MRERNPMTAQFVIVVFQEMAPWNNIRDDFCKQARLWACGRGDVSTPIFGSHLNPMCAHPVLKAYARQL